jgi:hypothetical protein
VAIFARLYKYGAIVLNPQGCIFLYQRVIDNADSFVTMEEATELWAPATALVCFPDTGRTGFVQAGTAWCKGKAAVYVLAGPGTGF